ncbi:MAG: hypothetical protein IH614_12315 [Desulfuromonadales bacterium]|nr:hypothetical protein [Desulfuromonadales bacterium]
MAIPWLHLVKLAPTIASLTNDLLQRSRPGEPRTAHSPPERLAELEAGLHRQAQALHGLAEQLQTTTVVLVGLRRRLLIALWLSGAALLLAGSALLLAALR